MFRWNYIAEWPKFHGSVTTYWATEVPNGDKMALVVNQRHYPGQWLAVTTPEGMTEADIKLGFEAFPAQIQNYLGIGLHGVPLPSDLKDTSLRNRRWELPSSWYPGLCSIKQYNKSRNRTCGSENPLASHASTN
jgi:hypothetical protein